MSSKETITSKSQCESSKVIYNEIICDQASVKISTNIFKFKDCKLFPLACCNWKKSYVTMAELENWLFNKKRHWGESMTDYLVVKQPFHTVQLLYWALIMKLFSYFTCDKPLIFAVKLDIKYALNTGIKCTLNTWKTSKFAKSWVHLQKDRWNKSSAESWRYKFQMQTVLQNFKSSITSNFLSCFGCLTLPITDSVHSLSFKHK